MATFSFFRGFNRPNPSILWYDEYLHANAAEIDNVDELIFDYQNWFYRQHEHYQFESTFAVFFSQLYDESIRRGTDLVYLFESDIKEDFIGRIEAERHYSTAQTVLNRIAEYNTGVGIKTIHKISRFDNVTNEVILYFNDNSVTPDWDAIIALIQS